MQYFDPYILVALGFLHIVTFIAVVYDTQKHNNQGVCQTLWLMIIALFPFIGVIIYLLFGRRI